MSSSPLEVEEFGKYINSNETVVLDSAEAS